MNGRRGAWKSFLLLVLAIPAIWFGPNLVLRARLARLDPETQAPAELADWAQSALESGDRALVAQGLRLMAAIQDPKAVERPLPALLAVALTGSTESRFQSLLCLAGLIRGPLANTARPGRLGYFLVSLLDDGHPRVRLAAAYALAGAEDAVRKTGGPTLVFDAVRSNLDQARMAEACLAGLTENTDGDLMRFAQQSLADLGPAAGDVLLAALSDEEENVAAGAAENLGRIGQGTTGPEAQRAIARLKPLLAAPGLRLRLAVVEALGRLGSNEGSFDAARVLADSWGDFTAGTPARKIAALEILARAARAYAASGGRSATADLAVVLQGLVDWTGPGGVELAGPAAEADPVTAAATACAMSLVDVLDKLGDPAALQTLMALVAKGKDPSLRAAALAAACRELGHDPALEELALSMEATLRTADGSRPAQLLEALGLLDTPRSIQRLMAVVASPQVGSLERRTACGVLARSGRLASVPALIDALEAQDAFVRKEASDALRKLTGQYFDFRAYESVELRTQAVARWRQWWAEQEAGQGRLK